MIKEGVPMGQRRSVRIRIALLAAALVVLGCVVIAQAADPEIPLVIEKNRFEPDVIKVKAGAPFVLVITNKDKGPEEFDMQTPRIEKVIPAGKTMKVRIPALKPGKYPFVGEYHAETMGATFVITLREAFEAALVLGIIYSYLGKIGARDGFSYVTRGGVVGLLASLGMGVGVGYLSGPLLDVGPDIVTVVVMLAAVALLTWHAWWMQQHARLIKSNMQHRIDEARAGNRLWVVGLIAFTAVFREGAETVLFLWGIVAQSGGGWGSAMGGVAGVACAAAIGWAIFRGGQRLSLTRFFSVTTIFIMLLAAGLLSSAVARLQGMGLLPLSEPLWNTSWLLSDGSLAGGFLSGLIGYRAQPTLLEVCVYVAYVIVASLLLFTRRTPAPVGFASPTRS